MAVERVYIGGIDVDCTVSETHNLTADVTMHRVASGEDVTDNARFRPISLEMTCWVSNTPLRVPDEFAGQAVETNHIIPYQTRTKSRTSREIEYQVPRRLNASLFGINVSAPFSTALTSGNDPLFGLETRKALTAPQQGVFEDKNAVARNFSSDVSRRSAVYDHFVTQMERSLVQEVVTSLRTYENMLIESISAPVSSDSGDALKFVIKLKQVRFASVGAQDLNVPKIDAGEKKARQGSKPKDDKAAEAKKEGANDSVLSFATGAGQN